MDRRKFFQTGLAGVAGLSWAGPGLAEVNYGSLSDTTVDTVKLGDTGLTVSRIAMGTGTKGWNHQSNQTRMGMKDFVSLARHGYERGIRFFDMADAYGSQPFVGASILNLPRENITLMSKIWTSDDSAKDKEPVRKTLDRFRQETGSEYLDILLLHCMTNGDWADTRKFYMDGLSEAKQEGIVKAVGVSCHNWDAMVKAVENPWVDVILARINPFQTHMDNTPGAVSELLRKARKNGKGIIGMKIFGEGKNVTDEERERSIRFALTQGNVHAMTLGLESMRQMDDAIERVMRISRE